MLASTALTVAAYSAPARAQDATWLASPTDNNYDNGVNWSSGTAPSGSASFGVSNVTSLSISSINTTVGGWIFGAGASNYSFSTAGILSFNGAGIIINGGSATITNYGALTFGAASTAGSATITNNAGLYFRHNSTAGSSAITNNDGLYFYATSTAGSAAIINNDILGFFDTSTAGSATITNHGGLTFYATSAAGSANITNHHNVSFSRTSTADGATITNYGSLGFSETSTAGGANITNNMSLQFSGASTAGSATITNNYGLYFSNTSTAGGATVTNNNDLQFSGMSSAGSATITNNNGLYFAGTSTADSAAITNDRDLSFHATSTAGSATIANDSYLQFNGSSTAGSAAITNNDNLYFFGTSTGGSATIANNAGATVDFSSSTGPAGDNRLGAGSIAGAGNYILGSNELTVGSNNQSTEVSGVISGVGGSLVKTGTGTLTLAGANIYTRGTTISGGTLQIGNGGTTGSILGAVAVGASGTFDLVTADTADITSITNSGSTYFRDGTSAGSTTITNNNNLRFYNTSTARSAVITNNGGLYFGNTSTAGGADITNDRTLTFGGASTAGSAAITNNDILNFYDNSTAGGATITNNAGVDYNDDLYFYDNSTAGSATITNHGGLIFSATSAAGSANITNYRNVRFSNTSTAGGANITNYSSLSFSNTSTAGGATITNNDGLFFFATSSAGSATITNNSLLRFTFTSTAGSATITNNDGLYFSATSSAGSATITTNNNLVFDGSSTAGSAAITNNANLYFLDSSTAGSATIANNAGATVDFSSSTGPAGDKRLGAGSIAGAGNYILGSNELTVGSNNLSTAVSGVISGAGGSLVKTGTGTLTLAGANTYTGGTTISAGTLQIGNGGTTGTILGAVAVGASGTFDLVTADTAGITSITNGGSTYFRNGTSPGSTTITNSRDLNFLDASTAGSAAITNNSVLAFFGNSTAGSAAIVNHPGGAVDFSGTNGPNGEGRISAGSIAGAGSYLLGANELTVGSNDLSTEVSGVISGVGGALVKTGAGTLTLAGENSYTGGTAISDGTLQLGNGGGTGSILGNVVNDAVLAFNRSDAITFAGDISGSGAVRQIGSGTTILTGTNRYTGDTLVSGGRLQFGDGSAGGSNTLGGNVTVTGGTLAIQTPATLNVAQTVTLGDNTALSIRAGANSPSLSAESVMIGNGVAFNISGIDDASQLDKVLINTTSGIGGDFAGVTVGGFSGTVDYLTVSTRKSADTLQYLASYGLTWTAGNDLAHGTFTLTNPTDSFTVGTALADHAANPATGWNGTALTKTGAGTLILTADSTYSGGTAINAGTLQLGNGGATGSISGDVVNGGVLAFNRSNVATFAGGISGSGAVRQLGSGTTILTGTNSYSGGTTISGGVLSVSRDANLGAVTGGLSFNGGTLRTTANLTTSRAVDLLGSGTVEIDSNTTATFGGVIYGAGALIKQGSGSLHLTAENTYAGGTVITNGVLRLGDGATSGAIQGDVVNNGSLYFDRSDNVTFAGNISGSGLVQQLGTGTLTLTGANSYSGGTTIAGGTLQVGNGGATGSISGNVVNDGVLAFNRTGTLTLAGDISGSGAVRQIGSGTTILTGTNTYSGDTFVSGGRLQFGDGSAGGSNTLGGNVTVTGGTLAIQTPATLNVAQNVSFDNNPTLSVVAGANGPALSAGSVTIGNGVTFDISGIDDASQLDKVLIDTTSGIAGDFAGVTIGGFSDTVDYLTVSTRKSTNSLQYLASYGLSWASGNNLASGTFTLTNATDSFTVGTVLADQAANPATGWNGTSLTKAGTGTLTLTGDNTYSGGTTISGGVLSVSRNANLGAVTGGLTFTGGTLATTASFDTARSISLTQAGRFDVLGGTELGLTGVVSGSGDLVKSGAGTLRLDNSTNAYGNTLVAAGTLVGNAGSISGSIGNAGTVVFDQAGNASFAGGIAALDGTPGVMVKRGAGALTLTGTSSLDWTVETGRLIASAERFGGNVAIASGASFTFDQAVNAAYAGVMSGTGGFNKTGAGLLDLTGDSSGFSGTTTVAGGTLVVNGALGGTLDVLTAGRLQGIGTVGNTTVAGTIAPGNSIGTLNVAGNVTFNPGSIYEVEVNAAGQSDRIVAGRNATINGGSVKVLAGAGSYAPQTRYTILTANAPSGRSGTFSGVTSNLAFLDPSLSYDANNVYLTMTRNSIEFAAIGITPNQIATGGGIESLGFGNPVYNAALNLSADQAQYAFDQLSGEIHASAKTVLIEDSRLIRNAVTDRIRAAFDTVGASGIVTTYVDGKPVMVKANTDRVAVWGQGFGSWGHASGDGNAARLNRSTGGFFIGADAPVFDTWRFGAVAGYSRTSFDVKDRRSSGASDNYHVGLYGGTSWGISGGDVAFRTGAAYTWHDIATSRNVIFPGLGNSLKGDHNASTAQVFGELAYGVGAGGARFESFANFAYVNLRTDGFTEQGGAPALTGASFSTDAAFTTLGLRASTTFDFGGATVTAKGMIGWRHAFGDTIPLSTMRFAGGGDAFSIGGIPIMRNAAVIEAGLDYAVTPNATLGVSYGGQFGSGVSDQSARVNVNVTF
ncbi:hypothetical protein ASE63_21960 [Bosea sp. Root381]|nr:hypothetical protein ASE63_21960 [Bosea sp. Root381]